MLDAFGVQRTDISKKQTQNITYVREAPPTAEEKRRARYALGGAAAGVAAGLTQTPVLGGKFRGAVTGARGAAKGSMEVNRLIGGSKARGAINAARNVPAGAKSGVKSWKGYKLSTSGIGNMMVRTYAPVLGAYGGAVAGEGVGELRNQQLKLRKKKRKVSKSLPSALRGGAIMRGAGSNIIGRTMQNANWSGKQAAKQIAMQRTRSPKFRQGMAGGFIQQGKQQKSVRFQRDQWMGTDPNTGKMIDTRATRNANMGGFKGQFNAPPAKAKINPDLQARLAARKGS